MACSALDRFLKSDVDRFVTEYKAARKEGITNTIEAAELEEAQHKVITAYELRAKEQVKV